MASKKNLNQEDKDDKQRQVSNKANYELTSMTQANEGSLLNQQQGDSMASQAAHLGDNRLQLADRQAQAAMWGDMAGNNYLQQMVSRIPQQETASQSQPGQSGVVIQRMMLPAMMTANTILSAGHEAKKQEQWDEIVSSQIDQFVQQFQGIEIEVPYTETVMGEDGTSVEEERTAIVPVHPPYYNNVAKRKIPAMENRAATPGINQAIQAGVQAGTDLGLESPGGVKTGKSHPDQIKAVLEQALQDGLVSKKPNALHPDGDDLRAWLVTYGFGVDCSGLVAHTLNELLASIGGLNESDNATDEDSEALSGSHSQFKNTTDNHETNFTAVDSPDELRPGDVMGMGTHHVRIIQDVEVTAEGIAFTTGESSSVEDIGPKTRRWRFPNSDEFEGLERPARDGEIWVTASADDQAMDYGRYNELDEVTANQEPEESYASIDEFFQAGLEAIAEANAEVENQQDDKATE